jgi:alkanesulfonate monooxygenase SsuD/methylene tetrahydromethanopterin reductase-like flavin-dependent oxidoreductase (luciferase family)
MRFEPHHVEHLCIAGTPEECAERVRAYRDAGVAHLSLNPAADDDLLEQVELLHAAVGAATEAAA